MSIKVEIKEQSKTAKKEYPRCQILGDNSKKFYLYKYLDMEVAIKCLKYNTLRFAQPSSWKDNYEKLYYTADYSNVDKTGTFPKKLFACCFTHNKASEASWKTYTYNKSGLGSRCVQFKIRRSKFRKALNRALKGKGVAYEGLCNYELTDYNIRTIGEKLSQNYSEFIQNGIDLSGYLSLLLIKRQCFKYENECRFFLIPDDEKSFIVSGTKKNVRHIDLNLNWKDFVEDIIVDEKCTETELGMLKDVCSKAEIDVQIHRNNLYAVPIRLPIKIQ